MTFTGKTVGQQAESATVFEDIPAKGGSKNNAPNLLSRAKIPMSAPGKAPVFLLPYKMPAVILFCSSP